MTFEEYEDGAVLTWAGSHPKGSTESLAVTALGLTGESGEFADIIKKLYAHGHAFNDEVKDKLVKELGDILYYVAIGCWHLGLNMEEVAILNRKKLAERYPEGFESTRSQNRK